jgi:DUF971 family protein
VCIRRRPKCRATGPARKVLQTGKRDVGISQIEMVGHYAVQPTFTDGHDTGIFSWAYLYNLGSEGVFDSVASSATTS